MGMEKQYSIGLDFGSLSGRGVLADITDGRIVAEAVMEYPHGVMDSALPDGTPLVGEWCLQHPQDFVDVLEYVVPELLKNGQVDAAQVVGIGVDFTASTVVPLDSKLKPLCFQPEFQRNPHAWVKMWKHHGAAKQAQKLQEVCLQQGRDYPDWYGGRISAESLIPKVIQVFEEDKKVYEAATCFMEMGDYITTLLTGHPVCGISPLAAKSFWSSETGYPDGNFFGAVDPELRDMPKQKLSAHLPGAVIAFSGEKAGGLCEAMASRLGLLPGTAVSSFQMDAYAAMPGTGVAQPGTVMMILGTSTGIMLMSKERHSVEGVTACLKDTMIPGFWGYASGQSSVGDGFQWFADQCVPKDYWEAAEAKNMSIQQYLTELAAPLAPGETGLLALDWFNGNRSRLANSRLSAMVLGLTLQTKPEHIYRTLLEATAFGARQILDAYSEAGVPIDRIVVCGGIAGKNPLMMQIYADVFGKPLYVSTSKQAPALGAAIYGAAAAGERAGFSGLMDAIEAMSHPAYQVYQPNPAVWEAYDSLYREYSCLHDYFGRGENKVMERLLKQKNARK